jgi:hypothetical protein
MLVPCGKCLPCRTAHAREWAVRIVHESAYHKKSSFLTLTYSEQNMPENGSISKKELQNFFKRLRKNSGLELKYYAAGEYGEREKRPHYHAIVFGLGNSENEKELVLKSWQYRGFVYHGTVTHASARYVANYVHKNYIDEYDYDGRTPPFQLQSKGIGKEFAYDNKDLIERNLSLTIGGKPVGLPRYYRIKLGIESERFGELQQKRKDELLEHLEQRGISDDDVLKALVEARYQSARTQSTKDRLFNKSQL